MVGENGSREMTEYKVSTENPNLRYYASGSVIIAEGEENDGTIFVLNSGKLGVYKGGRKIADIEENGTFFGEVTALANKPHDCTVRALTEASIMAYPRDAIVQDFPEVAEKLFVTISSKIQKTEHENRSLVLLMNELSDENRRMNQEMSNLISAQAALKELIEIKRTEIENLRERTQRVSRPTTEEERKRRWSFFRR